MSDKTKYTIHTYYHLRLIAFSALWTIGVWLLKMVSSEGDYIFPVSRSKVVVKVPVRDKRSIWKKTWSKVDLFICKKANLKKQKTETGGMSPPAISKKWGEGPSISSLSISWKVSSKWVLILRRSFEQLIHNQILFQIYVMLGTCSEPLVCETA